MVRTGDESGLSAPISFEGLGSVNAESIPETNDLCHSSTDNNDAVRVTVTTVVEFIANLQRREENAFPELRDAGQVILSGL